MRRNGDIRHMLDKTPPVTFETLVFSHCVCTVCRSMVVNE